MGYDANCILKNTSLCQIMGWKCLKYTPPGGIINITMEIPTGTSLGREAEITKGAI